MNSTLTTLAILITLSLGLVACENKPPVARIDWDSVQWGACQVNCTEEADAGGHWRTAALPDNNTH